MKLAYCPLSNYSFNYLKGDPIIQEILSDSNLYIITQRPEIKFENLVFIESRKVLCFDIKQDDNKKLECILPFFQKHIATDRTKMVFLELGSNDGNNKLDKMPFKNVDSIKFYEGDLENKEFLIWFSPEKFLQNYWNGDIEAKINGNIRDFLKYKVHYVGKATEQEIWKRLTGHSALQEILSVENPLKYGSLPTHEIAVLFLKYDDFVLIQQFGKDSIDEDLDNIVNGNDIPHKKAVYLDAEKALINTMQPKYNKILFKNYPKSKDGLHKYEYDTFTYTFMDPITLIYELGEIEGGLHELDGDTIMMIDNSRIEVYKQR